MIASTVKGRLCPPDEEDKKREIVVLEK